MVNIFFIWLQFLTFHDVFSISIQPYERTLKKMTPTYIIIFYFISETRLLESTFIEAKFLATEQQSLNLFNQFHLTGLFLYPLKTSEVSGFLIFSGGIERDQSHITTIPCALRPNDCLIFRIGLFILHLR